MDMSGNILQHFEAVRKSWLNSQSLLWTDLQQREIERRLQQVTIESNANPNEVELESRLKAMTLEDRDRTARKS